MGASVPAHGWVVCVVDEGGGGGRRRRAKREGEKGGSLKQTGGGALHYMLDEFLAADRFRRRGKTTPSLPLPLAAWHGMQKP